MKLHIVFEVELGDTVPVFVSDCADVASNAMTKDTRMLVVSIPDDAVDGLFKTVEVKGTL